MFSMSSVLPFVLLGACQVAALATSVPSQSIDQMFAAAELVPLRGRRALVTGATSGIGKATACALAAAGADLVLVGRREDRLIELKAEIAVRVPGLAVVAVAGDVRSDDLYESLRQRGCFEGLSILINNAGLARGRALVGEGALGEWREMLDTNCMAAFRMVDAALPHLVDGGHVVSMGSIAGLEPYEGGSVYSASKHALHAFMQALRYETYSRGIRCTTVAPGFVGEGTEFSEVRFEGDTERAAATYDGMRELRATDVAAQARPSARTPRSALGSHARPQRAEGPPGCRARAHRHRAGPRWTPFKAPAPAGRGEGRVPDEEAPLPSHR